MSLRRYYHRHFGHHERFHLAVIFTIVVVAYVVVPIAVRYIEALQGYSPHFYEPKDLERQEWLRRTGVPNQLAGLSWDVVVNTVLLILVAVVWLTLVPARVRRAPRGARQALRLPHRQRCDPGPVPRALRVAPARRPRRRGDAPGARSPARPARLRRLLRSAGTGEGSHVPRAGAPRRAAPGPDRRARFGRPLSPSYGAEPRRQRGRRRSRRPRARLAPRGVGLARPAPRRGDGPGARAHAGPGPLSALDAPAVASDMFSMDWRPGCGQVPGLVP